MVDRVWVQTLSGLLAVFLTSKLYPRRFLMTGPGKQIELKQASNIRHSRAKLSQYRPIKDQLQFSSSLLVCEKKEGESHKKKKKRERKKRKRKESIK